MIKIKRVYDTVDVEDGTRLLVDRLWPRGMGKDALKVDAWLKDVAPSTELRKWFGHDRAKWSEFRSRYFSELKSHADEWRPIVEAESKGTVTLLYSAADEARNNAVVLREFLKAHSTRGK